MFKWRNNMKDFLTDITSYSYVFMFCYSNILMVKIGIWLAQGRKKPLFPHIKMFIDKSF